MTLSGFTSVVSRRMFVTVALGASLFIGSNAWAQAAAAPAPQADPFKYTSESAVMIYSITSDKAAPFEAMWKGILAKLAASDKPELKALGESLKIYKVDAAPAAGQPQTYFMVADPASKTNSYQLTTLLYEAGLFTRAEADALFTPVGSGAFANINSIPTVKVQ
jgi:hypothetical protein